MEGVMKAFSFESLRVWHESRQLVRDIYAITRQDEFSRDYAFRDQIRRAAISVMSNIAEGSERDSPKEFAHFLRIAKGSCGEVRSQLYLAQDIRYVDEVVAASLRTQSAALSRRLSILRRKLISNSL
jgi:four helix bundle protein